MYFMHLSMLLHCLIDNEQHDQQRLQTNYWQKNVLKDMIMTSKRLESYYWQNIFHASQHALTSLIDNEQQDQ
jgi:hypothetical protein